MSTKFGRVLSVTWHSHDVEDSLSANVMSSLDVKLRDRRGMGMSRRLYGNGSDGLGEHCMSCRCYGSGCGDGLGEYSRASMCDARIESDGSDGSRARKIQKSGSRLDGAREQCNLDECLERYRKNERSLNLEGYPVSGVSKKHSRAIWHGFIELENDMAVRHDLDNCLESEDS